MSKVLQQKNCLWIQHHSSVDDGDGSIRVLTNAIREPDTLLHDLAYVCPTSVSRYPWWRNKDRRDGSFRKIMLQPTATV
jgi:hypothetical protein